MNTRNHYPIKLPDTDRFIRNGYYKAEIIDADDSSSNGTDFLKVTFRIFKGKYSGFTISTKIYHNSYKARVRLNYLCKACSITDELKSPNELTGNKVQIRVFNKKRTYNGRNYRDTLITRFHRLEQGD